MQNIPMFTTQNGVASLTLKEIPYTKKAYIRLCDSRCPKELLQECVDFCCAVGGEEIFATGHSILKEYPFHTAVLEMRRLLEGLPDTDACVFPVQEKTLEQWREIYNEKMQGVSNSAYMSIQDAKEYLKAGSAYFVHKDGQLLGIGIAKDARIDLVISVVPKAGADVLLALTHALSADDVSVEVASDNRPAIALYERLGFYKTREISRWYKVFSNVK